MSRGKSEVDVEVPSHEVADDSDRQTSDEACGNRVEFLLIHIDKTNCKETHSHCDQGTSNYLSVDAPHC